MRGMQPLTGVPMGDVLGAAWSNHYGYAEGLVEVWETDQFAVDKLVHRVWFWAELRHRGGRYRVQHSDSTPTVVCDGQTTVTLARRGGKEVDRAPGARPLPRVPGWILEPGMAMIWGRDGEDWKIVTDATAQVVDGVARISLTGADVDRGVGFADVVWPQGHLRRLRLETTRYELVDLHDMPPADPTTLFRTDLVIPNRLTGQTSRPAGPGSYGYVGSDPRSQ